jgi:hypothetical protein
MPFDPAVLLTLKFRGRSVVVPRDRCTDYDVGYSFWAFPNFRDVLSSDCTAAKQGIIAVAQRSLRSLRPFAQEDLVLMAVIPDHPNEKEVEVSKEAWPLVKVAVESVTIALESGASPMASRLFPTENPVAAAIDQPVLFTFSIELRSSGDWECDLGSTVTSGTSTRRSASPLRNPLFMKR